MGCQSRETFLAFYFFRPLQVKKNLMKGVAKDKEIPSPFDSRYIH